MRGNFDSSGARLDATNGFAPKRSFDSREAGLGGIAGLNSDGFKELR